MNYLGFDEKKLKDTAKELNSLLANYQVYYQNLRNFHWNIQGQHFFDLHAQFELLYNDAKINIDEIAERILTLRYKPLSTLKSYLSESEIKESEVEETKDMVKVILENHSVLIKTMRKLLATAGDAEDEGTIDLIASYLGELEKKSWMLDAWLAKA